MLSLSDADAHAHADADADAVASKYGPWADGRLWCWGGGGGAAGEPPDSGCSFTLLLRC